MFKGKDSIMKIFMDRKKKRDAKIKKVNKNKLMVFSSSSRENIKTDYDAMIRARKLAVLIEKEKIESDFKDLLEEYEREDALLLEEYAKEPIMATNAAAWLNKRTLIYK